MGFGKEKKSKGKREGGVDQEKPVYEQRDVCVPVGPISYPVPLVRRDDGKRGCT